MNQCDYYVCWFQLWPNMKREMLIYEYEPADQYEVIQPDKYKQIQPYEYE